MECVNYRIWFGEFVKQHLPQFSIYVSAASGAYRESLALVADFPQTIAHVAVLLSTLKISCVSFS
jgi:hypothetical protein